MYFCTLLHRRRNVFGATDGRLRPNLSFNKGYKMLKKIGRSFLVVALASICTFAIAQEKSTKSTRGSKATSSKSTSAKSKSAGTRSKKSATASNAPAGRLPRYFASLVDEEQRAEIYEIRVTFREKLEALEKELAELRESEMSAMEKVLTTTQRKKLAEMRASAEKPTKAKAASSRSTSSKGKSSSRTRKSSAKK